MKVVIVAGICLLCGSLFGQTHISLTGLVADAKTKEPLAFAAVSVKGTARGTITELDGRFQLNVPAVGERDTFALSARKRFHL